MRTPGEIALRIVSRRPDDSGGQTPFSVRCEDGEGIEYSVGRKRYIDADRAGFAGYVDDRVVSGLTQSEATALAEAMNAELDVLREEREARRAAYR